MQRNPEERLLFAVLVERQMLWNCLNTLYNVVMHFYLANLPAVSALFLLYYTYKNAHFRVQMYKLQ
jgi:hypothetical protein